MPPFTWGRYIIVSEKDAENTAVLIHEQAHLRAAHWLDLLLFRIIDCLLWYWPTAWLLTRDLQTIHEYEADKAVLNAGIVPSQYQIMLVQAGSGRTYPNVVNPFNSYYSLKKRIIMMKKKSSSAGSRMRVLVMLPVMAVLVLLISAPALASKEQSCLAKDLPVQQIEIVDDDIATSETDFENNDVINIVTPKDTAKQTQVHHVDATSDSEKTTRDKVEQDKIYVEVEVAPQFPGGKAEMYKWLSKNLRYPENAAKNNVQGRVIVQFVVEKDGSVGEVKVVRGKDPELDAEAIRVVKSMPNFIPGTMNGEPVRVWYTMPIMFKLAPSEKPASDSKITDVDPAKMVEAQYPGGESAMYGFLAKNILYPEADAAAGKSGEVKLNIIQL